MSDTPIEFSLYDTDLITKLCILPVLQGHLYLELNEPGSGEVKIPLDSVAAALVQDGQFIRSTYRGIEGKAFFVNNHEEAEVSEGENAARALSIQGKGALSYLDRMVVSPLSSGDTTRSFTGVSKGSILHTLLTEAVARGGYAALDWDFDGSTSSDSIAWTDAESMEITVGTKILELIRQFASTGEIEFDVTIQNTSQPILVSAYANGIGSDKSSTLFFRVGSNCREINSSTRGDKIINSYLVKYKGGYTVVEDAASIAARGRYEDILNLEAAQSSDSARTFAAAKLDEFSVPRESTGVKVFDGIKPYFLIDYVLGDTIKLDKFGDETSYRILGIQAEFDGKRYCNVTTEFNHIFYENDLRVAHDLDWLMRQWNTARDGNLTEVKQWVGVGQPNGEVYALHYYDNGLYVGGGFTAITGKLNTSYIARYDTVTGAWSSMGTAITSKVKAIADVSGDLYLATDTKIYWWDGAAWNQVGVIANLATGFIDSLYSDGVDLYVAGKGFTSIGGVGMASNVGRYDGSWHAIGSTVEYECLKVVNFNGVLYGAFELTGSGNRGLMKYVAGTWTPCFSTATQSAETLTVVGDNLAWLWGTNGTPYTINLWDGVAASPTLIGTIFSGGGTTGWRFRMESCLSDLYVGNIISLTGESTSFNNIARYSGGVWTAFNGGLDIVSAQIRAIAIVNGDVYVGGVFDTVNGIVGADGAKPIPNLAVWITTFQSLVDHLASGSSFDMGGAIHAAAASAVTDNDEFPFWDDVANALRKITFSNAKATLKTYFDTLYTAITAASIGDFIVSLTSKATPVDGDSLLLSDSAASDDGKKLTWANAKATLKTYFDTLYAIAAKGVTNGDSHDHNGGDGAQVDHVNLANNGSNTHAQIDTALTRLANTSGPNTGDQTNISGTAGGISAASAGYTPTASGGTATFNVSTGGFGGSYIVLGTYLYYFTFFVKCLTVGNNSGGVVNVALPFTSPVAQVVAGREVLLNGGALTGTIDAGGTVVALRFYNNTGVCIANYGYQISGILLK